MADDRLFSRLYSNLPVERRLKIDRLCSKEDQKRSLAAYVLLQKALNRKGIYDLTFSFGPHGKPALAKHKDVFFNLSHSGERAMCVLSDVEVGCDVEIVQKGKTAIAERFFHADECRMLKTLKSEAEKDDFFFRLWTLKESLIKASGDGFSLSMVDLCCQANENSLILEKEIDGHLFLANELCLERGYRYAVCSAEPMEFETKFISFS